MAKYCRVHYWIIGRDGKAVCKFCPATKVFPLEVIALNGQDRRQIGTIPRLYDPTGWLYAGNGELKEMAQRY